MKKQKFNNITEHWAWAYSYLRFYTKDNDIWGENREKLQPFFDWSEQDNREPMPEMPEKVREAHKLYGSIVFSSEGSDKEKKDVAERLERDELANLLGFVYPEDQETEDPDGNIDYILPSKEIPWSTREDISYPCIVSSCLEIGDDRYGSNTIALTSFVNETEFTHV